MPDRLLKKRPSKAKLKRIRRRKRIRRFIALSVIVIAVIALAVTFTNAGCDIVLGLAEDYVSENTNLNLIAGTVTGNPLKGYTMKNIELEDMNGEKIISAESLSLYMSLSSLKIAKLRIRNAIIHSRFVKINISRVDTDLRTFTTEIDADINGLPLRGNIDMGNASELTSINRADMKLGSGKITAIGGLFDDNIFDVHVTAEDLNLKEITAMFPDTLSSNDFDGDLNLNLDVTGIKESPRIFGSVDYRGTKIYGFPAERMSADYHYSVRDNMLMINNIQASAMSVPVQGEITATNLSGENVTMKIKLDGSETNLDALHEVLNIPELKGLNGRIETFNANIWGTMNSLNGLINLTSPRITYMNRTLSNLRLQMKLSGSNTGNVDGKFDFEGTNGFVQGNVESIFTGSNMNITAKIADMDIKRIENIIPDYPAYNLEGKITLSLSVKGSTSKPVITGSVSSNEFKVRSDNITKPVIEFKIQDEALTIEHTEGTLNGMPLTVTGTIKPFPSSNPELDITAGTAKITGVLNNPSIKLIDLAENKENSQDKRIIEIESESIKPESPESESESESVIPEPESRDKNIKSPDIRVSKEELSKDENIAD